MYLNCLCANLAYGLPELNKLTYLLTDSPINIAKTSKGALHELNQKVNRLVKYRRVARDLNPQLKLT